MHRILMIRLYFLLDALHVLDYMAIATQQPDIWYRHIPNTMYSL